MANGSENRWRVLVCGSRDGLDGLAFAQVDRCVGKVLEELGARDAEIVSGAARGGDAFGEQYAKAHGLPVARFPAEWDKHGKSAGFRRNLQMVDYLKERPGRGVVIAFWNGGKPRHHAHGLQRLRLRHPGLCRHAPVV